MDPNETARVEAFFELRQCVIDDVFPACERGERQFVLGDHMAHARDIQDDRVITDAGCDALEFAVWRQLRCELTCQRSYVKPRSAHEALEFVQRVLEPGGV